MWIERALTERRLRPRPTHRSAAALRPPRRHVPASIDRRFDRRLSHTGWLTHSSHPCVLPPAVGTRRGLRSLPAPFARKSIRNASAGHRKRIGLCTCAIREPVFWCSTRWPFLSIGSRCRVAFDGGAVRVRSSAARCRAFDAARRRRFANPNPAAARRAGDGRARAAFRRSARMAKGG